MTVINTNDKVTFERKEPLTGAVASTSPAMTVAQATAVADRAAAAFPAWSRTTPAERRRLCVALACLIGETQAAAAKALIDDATERGAKLLTGGELEGNFMRPAVLDNVTPDMRIYYEETFGPAACIVRARDAEHAL